jgi:hypothetical protein
LLFKYFHICLISIFLSIQNLSAGEVEGFFGAQYTQYKLISTDYNQYGASARTKYNWYKGGGSGLSAFALWNGHNVFVGDFMLGYGMKTNGKFYFELAGYGAFSLIWGLGFAVLGGVGYDLGGSYFLSIPMVFRYPGFFGVIPMFGYRF